MELVELGEISKFSQGQQVSLSEQKKERFENSDVFLRIVNYTQNSDEYRYIKRQPEKYHIKKDDIIMVRYGAVGFVGRGYEGVLANNMFKIDNDKSIINNDYLFYVLNSKKIQNKILHFAQSTSMPAISFKTIKSLKIPLPSLAEQKRIAGILDEADKLRQLNKQLISKYEQLSQSLFLEMFGDPVTNPKDWETKTIEDLIKSEKFALKRGPFGGALKKEIFVEEGYLVYEQFHALNNDFSFERYFINEKKYEELKGFSVKPKDIIISCSGVYLGKLAEIPEGAKKGIINQALLKVSLDEKKMRNDFFIFHFTQERFKQTFFDSNRGAGIPNFPPMKEFKKFPFISPPISLQTQFAERVQLIEQQKVQAQEALQKSEDLFNVLLQKAFKGEL